MVQPQSENAVLGVSFLDYSLAYTYLELRSCLINATLKKLH
jgi:hypothetical protein